MYAQNYFLPQATTIALFLEALFLAVYHVNQTLNGLQFRSFWSIEISKFSRFFFAEQWKWRRDFSTGLLGSITKTAEVNECPGKCLHALASLLCEEVREDIGCPSAQMRCCVDRRNDNSTPSNGDQSQVESTTKKRLRPPPPPPPRTTPRTTTTTTTTTTQRAVPDVASNKQDKFGDYEYTDDESNSLTSRQNSASRFIMTSSAFLLCSTFLLFI